ncbi:MAG: hypothetical protein QM704_19005 [Anaeromyxobacteraceae bacterium]
MTKPNGRLEAARLAYREALEAARAKPSQEAWARLLAAGRELSVAEQPPPRSRRRRQPERPAEPVEVEPEAELDPAE